MPLYNPASSGTGAQATTVIPDGPMGFSGVLARLALRETGPVIWVTCGSSTTYNATMPEADRYPQKVTTEIQKAYPASAAPAVRTLAAAVSAAPSGPGIHTVNAGVSGSNSGDFLTSTTRGQIVALGPHAISYMIGSNDYGNGIPVATFKANLLTHLTAFDTLGYKRGHQFFHSYPRTDAATATAKVAEWPEYLAALQEIAATRRDVSVIDLSRDFEAVDIPGTDVEAFMHSDLIHLVAAGQTFLAKLIAKYLLGALVPEAAATVTRTIVTSDSFSGTAVTTMSGKSTDTLAGGGSAVAYQSTAFGSYGINASGNLYRSAGATEFLGVPVTQANIDFEFVATTLSNATGTVLNAVDIRRQALAAGSDCVRLRMRSDGSMSLSNIISTTETELVSITAGTLTAGATVRVRLIGGNITVSVNGTTVATATTTVTAAGFAGFTKSSTISTVAYNDFAIYALT